MDKVVFYLEPYLDTDHSTVLAVFIDHKWSNGYFTCFSWFEQHSICKQEYLDTLPKATEKQYQHLLDELVRIGYTLIVED